MKNSNKFVWTALAALFAVGVLSLVGCGGTDDGSGQADRVAQYEITETETSNTETQTAEDTARTLDDMSGQGGGTSSIVVRAYSEREKERMAELKQSYQNEAAKPEKMIQEVDSAESVTEGTLCYIRSTGEYYLPDRELTDEELLEIIDCNFRIAVNSQGWTQEKVDEADRRDRAILEEKVKAAGGISEDEAIEIARKAMEADIGEKAKELEVYIYPDLASNGWKLRLFDITDWDEYKDKGDIAYSVTFGNKEEVMDPKDFFNYDCFVNAVDGSICGAYSLSGDLGTDWDIDDFVWYEH